ncbi:MAG TPA: MotA/TolQ/ExbB proton channel family protein [Bacteroidota bacterium]|jgi:biopolymer transport protein ExbB|nr:MotA/TolQ/ExbB proton channel family protein [Bacteroidota bacterium]
MKQSTFVVILVVSAIVAGFCIWQFVLGNPANFKDGANREKPDNLLATVYVGGYIVPALIALSVMVITFIIERALSLRKARGRGQLATFLKNLQRSLSSGDIPAAIQACDQQRGSMANIIRAGLERYQTEKAMPEVQRAIEEATALEMPILEKNLIAMSTIASISTMLGLFGTVIGMIRSFRALAQAGAPDAIQLSIGISEALINTALGIFAAIVGIVAYNFFVNKVDSFTYMIDEASYDVIQTLTSRSK